MKKDYFNIQEQEMPEPKMVDRESYELYMRLLDKYMRESPRLLPRAEESLKLVQSKCQAYAKRHRMKVVTDISIEDYTATVSLVGNTLTLNQEEQELITDIKDQITGIVVFPLSDRLSVEITIKYFADGDSPSARAAAEYEQIKGVMDLL